MLFYKNECLKFPPNFAYFEEFQIDDKLEKYHNKYFHSLHFDSSI